MTHGQINIGRIFQEIENWKGSLSYGWIHEIEEIHMGFIFLESKYFKKTERYFNYGSKREWIKVMELNGQS